MFETVLEDLIYFHWPMGFVQTGQLFTTLVAGPRIFYLRSIVASQATIGDRDGEVWTKTSKLDHCSSLALEFWPFNVADRVA